MKYKVLIPLARIAQPFFVGDLIEIEDKVEAERMIAAGIVAAIKREIRVETADAQPVGVEVTAKTAKLVKTVKSGGKKR